eukprot:3933029-Rhodomonas_salina.3
MTGMTSKLCHMASWTEAGNGERSEAELLAARARSEKRKDRSVAFPLTRSWPTSCPWHPCRCL